ncbi:MAG TPA: putative Ig domain-containing protein [Pseudonocardiaceae bacterium]|nr:putative Ig domain-containing protein [Pseudonocardiaceae bacterium]
MSSHAGIARPRCRSRRAGIVGLSVLSLVVGVLAIPADARSGVVRTHQVTSRHACAAPKRPDLLSCFALVRTDLPVRPADAAGTPAGYAPQDLQSAYALPSSSAGAGLTVAVVDAFDYPGAESDLATYRAQYGLPPCTTANGCFRKADEHGGTSYPAPDAGWAAEAALDIDMVSAICPNCHITLMEATQPSVVDLGTAVNTAVSLGAVAVSNSYGGPENSAQVGADWYFDHRGVAITVSAGDSGYGLLYPASSSHVVAVGGTSLIRSSGGRGWTESAWNRTSSGCSAYESKPVWQADSGCVRRAVADVAAVADPATGVAVYDTYRTTTGWQVFGGTSVSAPIIAGVYALAGRPAGTGYPSSYPYSHPSALNDVTVGTNGTCAVGYLCTAGAGYDGPTGSGTPNGITAFGMVTVTDPGNQSSTVGIPVSLQIRATSTPGCTLSYHAVGLPAGLSIATLSGLISGTPTVTGTSAVTVTATDCTGASGSASFGWTVNSGGTGTSITNGGFETGGLSGWVSTGLTGVTTTARHSGSYATIVGSMLASRDSSISQTFRAADGSTTLSFWYDVICPDTLTYDWATATLRDNSTGMVTRVLPMTCVSNSGWRQVDSAIAAGHSYTLTLTSHDDGYPADPTYTLYDDVTVH